MKHLYLLRLSLLVIVFSVLSAHVALGQVFSTQPGSWNTAATWGGAVPPPGSDVVIQHAVILNTSPNMNSVTIDTGGSLQFGNSVTGRTLTLAADFTMNASANAVTVNTSGTHSIVLGGNFTHNGGTFTPTNGTGRLNVTFNGNTTQTLGGSQATTFNNVSVTTTGTTTVNQTADVTIGGNLTVANGAIFNSSSAITVTGTTNIGSGTSGTFGIPSATGAKIFNGAVTLGNGATWNNSGNSAVTFRNGITATGATFTAGSGVHTFDTNSQAITGIFVIPSVTITSPTVLTNNNSLTVSTALNGTGSLTQAANATLDIGVPGTPGLTTLNASAAGNSVTYSGTAQTLITAAPYVNLTLSGSGVKTIPAGITGINGNLTLTGSASATTGGNMNVIGNLSIGNGTQLTLAGFALTVFGQTNVGGGTSGTLSFNSSAGAKTFAGPVTINNGGTWDNSGNCAVTFRNGITNNGTFTAGTGVNTFDTNNQLLTGTSGIFTIPRVTVTGVTLTNGGTLNVSTDLAGTGTLQQVTNSVLNIGGTSGITTINAASATNDVNYSGSAQTVHGGNYWNLTLSGSGAKTLTGTTTSTSGNFTMTGSASVTTVAGLAIGGNLNLSNTSSFTAAGFPLTVSGTTNINNGSTLSFSSASGTKTFNDVVTVGLGGTWSNAAANSPVTFHNGLSSSGTFNAGTGVYTFDTNNQQIAGTLNIPNVTVTGVSLTNNNSLTVSTALSGTGSLVQAANANLFLGGTAGITTFNATATGNTVTYNGGTQTIVGNSYYNLAIANGTTLNVGAIALTVAGTTTVGGGSSGTLAINGAGSPKIFVGPVTIATGATWNNSGNSDVTFRNGVNNNASFTAGTGIHTFDTNNQALSGSFSIPNVTVTGITLTNNNSLAVSTALSGTGALTQNANATLNIGGTSGITTLNATASGNTVQYTGAGAQTVHNNNYASLDFNGGGVKTLQTGTTVVSGYFRVGGTATVNGAVGLTIGGDVLLNSGTFVSGAFNHQVAGNWLNGGGAFTGGTGTITFNGTSQTIGGPTSTTFNNITTSGASSVTTAVATTVGGVLTVANGTSFSVGGFPITVNGATIIGASGNVVLSSGTGTKIFTGLVNNGGTWNNSGNAAVTFRGGVTNGGTFNAGSGVHTFDTNNQALSGIFSIPSVTVTGITLTNTNDLTVSNALAGTGGLTQGSSSTLNLGGGVSITTLAASAAGNSVTYSGSGQTVFPTTYNNLDINQSGGQASLNGTTTIGGTLTLSNGNLNIGSNNLLLGAAAVSVSSPSASKMIIASGTGEVRRTFTAAGSYTFPVGDNAGTLEYSPITINYTSGSFSSAYVGVSVTDSKHPFNASTTNYLTRYWSINQSGITGGSATITATYPSADVVGTETSVKSAFLRGAFNQATNPWTKFGALGSNTLTVTGVNILPGQTSYCTGVGGGDPTVSITGGPFSICAGSSVVLNTSVTGDGPFTYVWAPATGLSATTVANPTASPTTTTNYTVTVTDANGITATNNANVTVNQIPALSSTLAPNPVCSGTSFTYTPSTSAPSPTFAWTRAVVSGISEPASSGSGAVNEVLTNVSNVPVAVTYSYVTTSSGCNSPAENVVVYVAPAPSATDPADMVVCNGSSTAAVTFTGVATSYDWTNSNPSINLPASGTGNIASFTATNAGAVPAVANIVVTPKYTYGATTCLGPTQTFTITVQPTASVNAVGNQNVCNGANTTAINFSGNATGYSWTNDQPSIGLAASGTGNIGAFTAVNSGSTPVVANIVVTPSNGACAGATTSFTITVNPTSGVNAIPNQVVCNGAPVTAINFSGTAGASFSWTNDSPSIGLGTSGNGNIPTFNAVNSGTTPVTATITVTPVIGSCPGTPRTFTIAVNPTPTVTTPSNQVICNGANTAAINFSGTATSFDWSNDTPSIGLAGSGTGSIASFVATNATPSAVVATITVTPKYTFGSVTCSGTPQNFTITVQPVSTVVDPADQTVCNGGLTTAVAFTGTGASSYSWTNDNTAIGLAGSGTGNIAAFNATNGGATPQIATITVTPYAGSCPGTPQTFTITVQPTAVVTKPGDQTVCNGANTNAVNFTGVATTFRWTNNTPGIGLAASGTGNIPAFAAVNAGSTPVVATITVTPEYTVSCVGAAQMFTITVQPTPVVNAIASQELCNGSTTTAVSFSGVGTYTWTNDTPSIGLAASGSGNIPAFTAINSGGVAAVATITVTPSVGACNGSTKTFTITVDPTPNVTAIADQSVCNGASTTAITFSGTGTSYTWTNNTPSIGLAASGTGNIAAFNGTNSGTTPVTATITVTPVFTGGVTCNGPTKTFTITVNPTPTVSIPSDQTVCNGASTTAITFSGTATSFDWTNNTPSIGLAASGTGNIASFAAANAGSTPVTATITVTPKYTFGGITCAGTPQNFTITVQPTPVVTAVANQVVCNGANTTSVSFTGTATSYTWTNDNTSIGLSASGTGNIAAFPAVNNGSVHTIATITVTPVYGSCTGATTSFTITVNPTPTANTPSNQTVCNGANTTAVSFTGTGTSYDWTNDTPSIGLAASGTGNIAAFAATNGGTTPVTATITITPKYTFGAVTCLGPAKVFTITVQPTPVVNAIGNQELCNGSNTTAVSFSGVGTYTWTNDTPSIGLAASGSGNIPAFTAINSGGVAVVATITVTPSVGACNGSTKTFTITVDPTPNVTAIADQSVCNGASTTAITFSGTGTSYTWTNNTPSIGLAASGTGNIAAFNGTNSGTTPVTATITVTPVFTGGVTCNGPTKTFTITVNPTPTVSIPSNQTVCNGASTTAITFSGTATSFDWTNNTPSIGLAASGTGNIASFAAANAGSTPVTATITVTPKYTFGGITCTGTPQNFTITVQPTPVVTAVANQVVCNGANTTSVSFTGTATSYTWTNDNTSIGLSASGTGNIAAFPAVNNGSFHTIATITVTPVYGSCTGATTSFTITVNPTPTANTPSNQTVCNGASTTAVSFTGTGTSYDWTNDTPSIGLAASGTGNIAAFAATNGGTTPVTATITITPKYTFGAVTCLGPVKVFTITVQPTPVVNAIASQELCAGSSSTLVTFSGTATGYTWTNDTPGIGLPASGSGNIAPFTAVNNGNVPVTATITVTPQFGACTGSVKTFTFKVNPNPTFTTTNNAPNICSGATTNITFASPTASHSINVVSVNYGAVTGGTLTPGTSTFTNGNTLAEALVNNTNAPIDVVYTFNVTTTTTPSCPVAPVNQVVTVRVQPAPAFTVTNAAAQICSNSQTNITLNSTVAGAQIRIQSVAYGAATGTLAAGATYTNGQQITEVLRNNTNSPVTVTYTFESIVGSCGPSASQVVNVIVNPNPTFTATNNAANICSGASTNITFASPTANHRINVVSVNYGAVTGGTVTAGTTTFTNGNTLTEALANATNAPIDVVYTFNVTTTTTPSCPVTPVTQVITVRVQPASSFTATNNAPQFCSGNQANIVLNTPVTGAQVRLAAVNYGAANGTLSPGALYTNGQRLSEILTNNTNASVTVVYTFEAVVSGCTPSAQQIVNVIVDPIPTLATNLSAQELCEGQTPTLALTNPNNVAGTLYTWTVSTTNVTGASNQPTPVAASAINTALSLSSGATGTITYTVRAVSNGCFSSSESIQVTVRRQPTVSVPANVTQCEPTAIPLNGTIGGGASTALWSIVSGSGTLSSTNVVVGSPIAANATYSVAPSDVTTQVTMRLTTNDPDGPSGLCNVVSADYQITLNRSAKVNAGPDLTLCENIPSIALQGSSSFSPNGTQWSLVAPAAGTFGNATSPTSTYAFANPAESGTTVTLRLTAFDPDGVGPSGPCANVSDVMTLKINKLPIVNFVGFPDPSAMAKNQAAITLTGNQTGGNFTITPISSVIGATTQNPTDRVTFDPKFVTLGVNTVTYSYTDPATTCTNSTSQNVMINPVAVIDWVLEPGKATKPNSTTWEVCADQGRVRFIGDPQAKDGKAPLTRFAMSDSIPTGLLFGGVLNIIKDGDEYYLNTNGAVADTYFVRYTYINEFDAESRKEYFIQINASPAAAISVPNSCVKDEIQFTDASTLPSTTFGSVINKWNWDFDDQSFGLVQNPTHGYIRAGIYNITLTATTNKGCSGTTVKQIRVGEIPTVKFNWTALCTEADTNFEDKSTSGNSTIISYTWDFGDGTIINGAPGAPVLGGGGTTGGTFTKPTHEYAADGKYDTKLTVRTDDGCENSLAQTVSIFPYVEVDFSGNQGYTQSFETADNGWSAEALLSERGIENVSDSLRYSWFRGTGNDLNIYNNPKINAVAKNITAASDGNYMWWTGRRFSEDLYNPANPNDRYLNPDSYFKSESSAVNGPCFNLNALTRPMIALDYWSDAELNRDGAVVQYSVDGGLNWELVGPLPGLQDRDQGINWYKSQGIIGKPGNQRSAGDYGWSGRSGGWLNARFNLDMIDSTLREKVRIRIAFGSDDNNEASPQGYDGFAFDNVFVGNKQRNVLVEHFTSAEAGSKAIDQGLNLLLQDQIDFRAGYGGESDFNDIQYHINSPAFDQLYKDNEIDPSTRAGFMFVSKAPTTLMDGLRSAKFTGALSQITKIELDRRALVDPQLDMRLDTIAIDLNALNISNKIKPVITLTARKSFTTPLLLNVALIEDNINGDRHVLRKLLFGSEGLTINNAINQGEVIIRDKDVIDINVPITNPTGLSMIAFVQDKNTKEILQSVTRKVKYKVGTAPVGLGEETSEEAVATKAVKVYPNPASGKYYFGLPDGLRNGDNFKWKMSDQRGVIVREGTLGNAPGGQVEVGVDTLASGMYIIMIEGPDQSVAYHKLMVINHH